MRYLIAALLALPSVALAAALTLAATHAMGDPLDGIVIEDENNTPYARNMYGGWRDADHDCQDARQEVLIAESLVPPTLDDAGCRVVSGLWYGLFSGQAFTDPSKLDIDHLVPLKEAHQSGGHAWTRDRRRA